MAWRIEFDPAALKEFGKLGAMVQRDIGVYLDRLKEAKDPCVRGKPLRRDKTGFWRYRVDKYRIICKIEADRMVIFILRVGKRDKIYE